MNQLQLIGRIVNIISKDEAYTDEDKKKLLKVRLAVKKDRPTEDKDTDFINVKLWSHNAAFVRNYCEIGYLISCVGHIDAGMYVNNGEKIFYQDIVVDRVEIESTPKKQVLNEGTNNNENVQQKTQNYNNGYVQQQPQNYNNENVQQQPQNYNNGYVQQQPQNYNNGYVQQQPQNYNNENVKQQPQNYNNENVQQQPQNYNNGYVQQQSPFQEQVFRAPF